jgi:two-component system sensor histidine kinase KdpD
VIGGDVARVRPSPARIGSGCLVALVGAGGLLAWRTPSTGGDLAAAQTVGFLGVVVAASLVGGVLPAVLATLLGAAALGYGFTRPGHTLADASNAEIGTLVAFVLVALAGTIASALGARRRRRAARVTAEATALAALSRTALETPDVDSLLRAVRDAFGVERAELLDGDDPGPTLPREVVVPAGGDLLAVSGRRLGAGERRLLTAFGAHLGAHLAALRERSAAAARAAEAVQHTRAGLLAAAALLMRGPLAILQAATDMLLVAGDRLPGPDRVELEDVVRETSARLARMADDLQELGRLQAGQVHAQVGAPALADVVTAAGAGLSAKQVLVGPLPEVRADAALLERALSNVLATATRFSDRVELVGERRGARFELRVVGHGPGVTAHDWDTLFEPFRLLDDVPDSEGVGLALAVARGLVEAQGGSVRGEVTLGGGLTLVVDLPAAG